MIKVTLECISASNSIPADLQDTIPPKTAWRTAYIDEKRIMSFYPHVDNGTHIAFNPDNSWLVKEDTETIANLIKRENKESKLIN